MSLQRYQRQKICNYKKQAGEAAGRRKAHLKARTPQSRYDCQRSRFRGSPSRSAGSSTCNCCKFLLSRILYWFINSCRQSDGSAADLVAERQRRTAFCSR